MAGSKKPRIKVMFLDDFFDDLVGFHFVASKSSSSGFTPNAKAISSE